MNDVFGERVRNKSTEKNPGSSWKTRCSYGPLAEERKQATSCLPLLCQSPSGLMVRMSD